MVIGLFNLGAAEILVLLVMGGLCLATTVVAVVLAVTLGSRKQSPPNRPSRLETLEAENEQLHEEIARLEKERRPGVAEAESQHIREGIAEPRKDQAAGD